jgi:hypothetical protein
MGFPQRGALMIIALAGILTLNLAQILTAAAAVGALVYAQHEIRETQRRSNRELAYRWSERQHDPEFAELLAEASRFLTIREERPVDRRALEVARWSQWRRTDDDNVKRKGRILLYLNYLERVGGLFCEGRIDHTTALHLFGYTAHEYWNRWNWFVWLVRVADTNNPKTFQWWEQLGRAWALDNGRVQQPARSTLSRMEAKRPDQTETGQINPSSLERERLSIRLDDWSIELARVQ